jgi:hypothetical protein
MVAKTIFQGSLNGTIQKKSNTASSFISGWFFTASYSQSAKQDNNLNASWGG